MTVNEPALRSREADARRPESDGRPRVLVCDDSATMRAAMQSLLGARYALLLTASGEEALERAAQFAPEVILCDLLLPGISGAEVCRRKRAMPAIADVPFVLVTTLTDAGARADALEAGADDYLYKPIRERELLARVASLVRLREEMVRAEERLRALEAAHTQLASTQAALVRAEKLASVGALAAGLAHEINNPLACIKSGAVELAGHLDELDAAARAARVHVPQGGGTDDRLARALGEVRALASELADGANRIERIAQDLRVFTCPAVGPEELVDPREALDSAWTAVRAKLAALPSLVREIEAGEPLLASRTLVVQPLAVVLEHAVLAAGPQGRVRIQVRQIPGGVEIAVTDSGAGIPRDELARVFDPVFAPRRGSATGPGLSVAYGILHGLGGDLSVESPPGEGATFRLRFPRRPGAFARGGLDLQK
jgi:C4-dicarboxylate-specific signal transduction histidine kinase